MKNNLRVDCDRLCSPLRDLKKLNPKLLKQIGRFKLSYRGGNFSIVARSLSIHIPATGDWDQVLSVSAEALVEAEEAIARIPVISIETSGESLLVGGVTLDYVIEA